MKQAIYGFVIFLFLALPPVARISESIMVVHMHMQMPLLVISGMLMAPYLKQKFPQFFAKWNNNGVPGIILFLIIISFWMIPRTMDDAIANLGVEVFKFISFPLLAGVPLRDSWGKLTKRWKNIIYIFITLLFGLMAWVYILAPTQLCNNYLVTDQKALGWSFLFMALCVLIYFIQTLFIHEEDYE